MNEIQLDTNRVKNVVDEALLEHGIDSEELIPILLDVNTSLGYLPTTAMAEISNGMKLPISRVYSVASFYNMLSTEPRGEHVIQFCESAPCHVMGGRMVLQALQDELAINRVKQLRMVNGP
jgi:NADH-quinone oxidoreductase subunit E